MKTMFDHCSLKTYYSLLTKAAAVLQIRVEGYSVDKIFFAVKKTKKQKKQQESEVLVYFGYCKDAEEKQVVTLLR